MKNMQLVIEDDVHAKLKKLAEKERKSLGDLVRYLLALAVAQEGAAQ